MAEDKDYLGEKLRLAERAREDAYFRTLDQALIEQMRQKAHAEAEVAVQVQQLFTPSSYRSIFRRIPRSHCAMPLALPTGSLRR